MISIREDVHRLYADMAFCIRDLSILGFLVYVLGGTVGGFLESIPSDTER